VKHIVISVFLVVLAGTARAQPATGSDTPAPVAPAPAPAPVAPVAPPSVAPPPVAPAPVAHAPAAPAPAPAPAPDPAMTVAPLTDVTPAPAKKAEPGRASSRNFAGSVQLDYLALPEHTEPDTAFAGATVELSLKLAMDFGDHVTANVKVCYSCHGFEVGMAYFDIRAADELNFRVGRFTPAFGSFPLRYDPANHATSDKPLAYDMGRMVHFRDWNEGVLPAPWVDNGVEINGTHFFGVAQLDYAAYAISGPKGSAGDIDFNYVDSRSGDAYYVDNNSEPTVGARAALTLDLAPHDLLTIGASGMTGHYDPKAQLLFAIAGADATLQLGRTFIRSEYLARWTHYDLTDDPDEKFKFGPDSMRRYSKYFFKDGFDVEAEHPFGRVTLIARWDGLRRAGNELIGSELGAHAHVLRYTGGAAIRIVSSLQLKLSVERYLFSDFPDITAAHLGVAGPF
jgi:hypothetical protein